MSDQNFDNEDVKAALQRKTQDGPGTDNLDALPDSDFESFATEGVEKEGDK